MRSVPVKYSHARARGTASAAQSARPARKTVRRLFIASNLRNGSEHLMTAWRSRLAPGLLMTAASGFAALAYQIVWTQQASVWLGHETAAVLAVVAAFFGGLALGALALGPRIDRSARPARWYAACEALIGLWSFALAL